MRNILQELQTIQNARALADTDCRSPNREGGVCRHPPYHEKDGAVSADTLNHDPVTYARQQFDALKSFVSRQPTNWAKTGDKVIDAAKNTRFALRDTADKYAKTIKIALKNAADIYKMGNRMEVNIRYPQTPNDRIDADQQRKIADLHREFESYTRQHGIWFH